MKIAVYLSSREPADAALAEAADHLARLIGHEGHTLVYGGARKGLMERLARGVRRAGGRVWGVVPQLLADAGMVSDALDVEFRTAGLHDRKEVMMREADLFVALPGGIGTLDEIFTYLAAEVIGRHHGAAAPAPRPVVLVDAGGCWQRLVALVDNLVARGLADAESRALLRVARTPGELEALIRERARQLGETAAP